MTAAIELDDVHIHGCALKGLCLRVEAGAYAAIMGPPRCGKTTLLNVLALMRRPDIGEYFLFGLPTAMLEAHERSALRAHVELVPAEPELVPHLTALENVGLGLFHDPSAAAQRAQRARSLLELVGVERGEAPAAHLSGGERRRVAIACSLASRPSLLLCDDPTAGLDDHDAESVLRALDAVRADGLTIVTATRRADVAARAELTVLSLAAA